MKKDSVHKYTYVKNANNATKTHCNIVGMDFGWSWILLLPECQCVLRATATAVVYSKLAEVKAAAAAAEIQEATLVPMVSMCICTHETFSCTIWCVCITFVQLAHCLKVHANVENVKAAGEILRLDNVDVISFLWPSHSHTHTHTSKHTRAHTQLNSPASIQVLPIPKGLESHNLAAFSGNCCNLINFMCSFLFFYILIRFSLHSYIITFDWTITRCRITLRLLYFLCFFDHVSTLIVFTTLSVSLVSLFDLRWPEHRVQ